MDREQASRMSESTRSCGSCTLCCKLLGVHALDKPPYQWCAHCVTGAGCAIYAKRPFDCRAFHCMYVEEGSNVPGHWLPSRSGMILCSDPEGPRIEVHVDDVCPDAWREEPYYGDLKRWSIGAVVNESALRLRPMTFSRLPIISR